MSRDVIYIKNIGDDGGAMNDTKGWQQLWEG
jgi:hypothetical protein